MVRRVLAAVVVFLALLTETARAEARTVHLYAMGPGDECCSRYGHSLVCARESGQDVAEAAPHFAR